MERLKAITEEQLRLELRNTQPDIYYIPEGKLLTPAAREYLQQRKIKIGDEISSHAVLQMQTPRNEAPAPAAAEPAPASPKPRYVDYDTGAFYFEKPEHMTQLSGNKLVAKDHPRIAFRGKLDSLQALVTLDQAIIAENHGSRKLLDDLQDILGLLREMMRCEVLDEPFTKETVIGFTHEEIRARSHDPQKFFGIKQMSLPEYGMGRDYALLNQLRAAIREAEVAAVGAFREGSHYTRSDIVEELNRLSSALHVMMCMYLAGQYQ